MRRTSSGSLSYTLTKEGKSALVANQLQQLCASIYLEGVKVKMIHKKALYDRQSKEFSGAYEAIKGRLAAMKAERDHLVDTLEELTGREVNCED